MTTNELLTKMEAAAFAPFFQEEIKAIFDLDVSSGKFENETRDYTNAMKYLAKKLDPDKLTLLSEYESICQQIREFSARYGFISINAMISPSGIKGSSQYRESNESEALSPSI